MAETILDGTGEDIPGHRILDGTDLRSPTTEAATTWSCGSTRDRCRSSGSCLSTQIDDRKLFNFNSVSPDFVFKIGDVREGLMAMGRAVGLAGDQLRKLEAKAREIAK